MIKKQKGFGTVEVLLVVLVVVLLGLGGWYIFSKNNEGKNTDTTTNQNKEAKDPETPKNTVTLKVDDYSLMLEVPETLNDLQVNSSRDSSFEGKSFTQVTLATNALKDCNTPGGALGMINKLDGSYSTFPYGSLEGTDGVYVKQLDGFYLIFQDPQSNQCNGVDASATHSQVKQVIMDNGWTHKTN